MFDDLLASARNSCKNFPLIIFFFYFLFKRNSRVTVKNISHYFDY